MCGICGIVGLDGRQNGPDRGPRAAAMLERLEHRGPDETRMRAGTAAVLGATRLAIRGLHSGSQPIEHEPTGVVVACNGEIDNHRELRSWVESRGHAVPQESDIAVVLPLYLELGEDFVERLLGAFAIAVWDPRTDRLLLARDRAGERPLFFGVRGEEVIFASEVDAFLTGVSDTPALDLGAIARYLRFGCFASPGTPLAGVHRVGPGETVTISPAGVSRRRYWRWRIAESLKQEPSLDAVDEAIRTAVARQSDVDVPFGVFLSGGVDSSLVAAIARRLHPDRPLRSYTIRFREASYDEGKVAARVASHLGLDATEVEVGASSFPVELARLVATSGEPLGDPAWVPASLLARRASEHVKVALVGEGADELFGGYPTYLGALFARRYDRLPAVLREAIAAAVRGWPVSDKKVTVSFLLKRFLDGAGLDGLVRHRIWTSSISPSNLASLGVTLADDHETVGAGAVLDLVQRHDLETTLAEGLLTKADRASMGSSLELRAPFLDLGVMELAATLPRDSRVRRLTTKVLLKRCAERYLPRSIVHRRKRGLSVPLAAWLRGPLMPWASSLLESKRLADAGVENRSALALLESHRAGRADLARSIWTLLALSVWLDWLASRGSDSSRAKT